MRERPAACEGCPAHPRALGFVPPTVPADPTTVRVAIVGQGPGEQEAHTSRPFFENAPAGSILTGWLHQANLPRSSLWIGNTIQCWLPAGYRGSQPYGSTDPTRAMQRHCWQAHVGPSLHSLPNLEFVVPVGTPARHFFLGTSAGERYCGTFNPGTLPPLMSQETAQ